MNLPAAIVVMLCLLSGPLAVHWIERNIEIFIVAIGILATILAGGANAGLVREALSAPIMITVAVIAAAILFRETREALDRGFARMRARIPRAVLSAITIFVLAMLSSVITAIVAALVLVEIVGLLHIHEEQRANVVIAGCFAIGLGAALTPVGEPLSTLAAHALDLHFFGLFEWLAPWVIPGVAASSVLAGYFARGAYFEAPAGPHVRETLTSILVQGAKVFGFVAGLVLISEAYAPLARQFVPMLSDAALFWANTISAVLDNATLVALEVHGMSLDRARDVILALLISGGMLIPGNIPNVISAGALRISSRVWARVAIPIGLAMLGIYFAVLQVLV
jgi:predicted cation transporter